MLSTKSFVIHQLKEFNEYNNALFNIRARSLNNLVYWFAQILGSLSIGFVLDQKRLTRRFRAFTGWIILLIMVFVVHIWAYFYQKCVILVPHPVHQIRLIIRQSDIIPGSPFPQIPTRWTYLTIPMADELCCIFFVACLMPCGKQPSTGSWELCPMTQLNLHISRASVRPLTWKVPQFIPSPNYNHLQTSRFNQLERQALGVPTQLRRRKSSAELIDTFD